jgi:hypothetical protein
VTDAGQFVVFKPVPGGYVYGAPNVWLFGPRAHYLVNEAQKAEILTIVTSSSQALLWVTGISWIALSLLLGAGSLLLAYRAGYHGPGLSGVSVAAVVSFSIYAAFLMSRQLLLRRLRPVLAALTPTNERITSLEERRAIAGAVRPTTLSPTRRRVLTIACAVGAVAALAVLISRTIDMHETNQSILHALYVANADLSGLLSVLAIVLFVVSFVTFGRHPSRK